MDALGVVVVANDGDEQANAVLRELASDGVESVRFNLGDVRGSRLLARPGAFDLHVDGKWQRITAATTVWWHRAGSVDATGLDADERALALDETPHILQGGLGGSWCRWVDDPFDVARAELKIRSSLRPPASESFLPRPWLQTIHR